MLMAVWRCCNIEDEAFSGGIMTRNFAAILLATAATTMLPSAASAFTVTMDQALCPLETIGDTELDSWASALQASSGALSDDQNAKIAEAIGLCAQKNGWNDSDILPVSEFNIAIVSSIGVSDRLTAKGLDPVRYEAVLENRSPQDLRQLLDDPENSPALNQATEMLIAEVGDKLTDEIAADLGAYIAFTAQSQLAALKMLGMSE
jgi:hypothetical protein